MDPLNNPALIKTCRSIHPLIINAKASNKATKADSDNQMFHRIFANGFDDGASSAKMSHVKLDDRDRVLVVTGTVVDAPVDAVVAVVVVAAFSDFNTAVASEDGDGDDDDDVSRWTPSVRWIESPNPCPFIVTVQNHNTIPSSIVCP